MKFKLDENLPASSAAVLARAGHDVDTVTAEGLTGAPDRDVVVAATAEGRILISLDVGMGDIRAYPPGSHAGIVVLRVPDQSAATVTEAINDLADLAEPASLTGAMPSCSADCCASAVPDGASRPSTSPTTDLESGQDLWDARTVPVAVTWSFRRSARIR